MAYEKGSLVLYCSTSAILCDDRNYYGKQTQHNKSDDDIGDNLPRLVQLLGVLIAFLENETANPNQKIGNRNDHDEAPPRIHSNILESVVYSEERSNGND
jgi:hypothetical protein